MSELLTAGAIREHCAEVARETMAGRSAHFRWREERLAAVADYVVDVIRARYPSLAVPFHSRWRHFEAGGIDRWSGLAARHGRVLMVGHLMEYHPAIPAIRRMIVAGELGDIRRIESRRTNHGILRTDENVWLAFAPHDISIILHILGQMPLIVNCRGEAHITPGIEDVTNIHLTFPKHRSALIQSSWLDPRKVREMTIVGSRRMIVYDDVAPLEKIKIFDARVEVPPHYDTFAEFQYSYHYGDMYVPYLKQEEPLKSECQHFLDCIRNGKTPLSNNIYGATLGGPVIRNKTFFFGNFDYTRLRSGVLPGFGNTTPTDAFKAGDFSALLTGNQIGTDALGRPRFPGGGAPRPRPERFQGGDSVWRERRRTAAVARR